MSTVIPLHSAGAVLPIDEAKLVSWLATALPGDALEYHRGFLVIDRMPILGDRDPDRRLRLARTSDRAMQLAERGLVHLVQRRLAEDRFSYLVIARALPKNGMKLNAARDHREAA